MKNKFTFLIAAFAALMLITQTGMVKGQTRQTDQLLSDDFSSITTGNSTSSNGSSSAWNGDDDFPTTSTVYKAGGAVRIGGNNKSGSITSKELDVKTGTLKVYLDIKGWGSAGTVTVTFNGDSESVTSSTSSWSDGFESKYVDFTVEDDIDDISVVISTTNSRAFVDNVVVENIYNTTPATPSMSISDDELALPYTANDNGNFTVSYSNYTPAFAMATLYTDEECNEAFPTSGANAWIILAENMTDSYTKIPYSVSDNTITAQRTVYMKVEALDSGDNELDEVFAITQAAAPTTHTVTFNCNGGESGCPTASQSVLEGTQITLPAAPTRDGYTFNCNGWLNTSNSNHYAPGDEYTVTANVTFQADWIQNQAAPIIVVEGESTGTANTYYNTATVSITQVSGYTYYYTTNGDAPTTSSTEYSSALTVNTIGQTTIKAIATKDGCEVSPVATQTVRIVSKATFTDGVYSESFGSSLGLWSSYSVSGTYKWAQGTPVTNYTGANINGYAENANNLDYLISPMMVALNGKIVMSFKTASRYSGAAMTVKYSIDYDGYSDPTSSSFTWVSVSPSLNTNTNSSFSGWTDGEVIVANLDDNIKVYLAFIYTSSYHSAKQYVIKDFEAKQCYPIIYNANYTNGSSVSYGPYAVDEEVTVRANEGDGNPNFEAPDGMEFVCWNLQANGQGICYEPGDSFPMGSAPVNLYAKWEEPCTVTPTMAATTNANAYVNDSGTKSWTVTFTSKATALGGCDIYDYGFVYSSTVSDPDELKIGEDDCIKESVGISYPTANTDFNYAKTGVDAGATIYVRSYAINAAGTAYGAVATVTTAAFPTYTISYSTNGHDETSTTIYQGDAISGLINPTTSYIPAGYTFMGWYNGDYASVNIAPSYVKNGDAISGNLELKAVFAVASTDEETVDASLEIIPSDFTSGGYAANDGDHEKSDITYNTYNVYQQSLSNIQFKSNSGYLYNKTSLNLTSIALSNISQGAFTVYAGTEEHPTTTSISGQNNVYTISDNSYKYFTIKGGSNTPRVGTITVNYTTTASVTTYSNYCTSVTSVTMTEDVTIAGDLNLTYTLTVPSGKTLTVTGDLVNNNVNRLIIEDGGQLICNNSVAATVQKSVASWTGSKGDADGWYAIASPVNTVAITSFAQGTHNVYRYDEATHFWQEYHNWGGVVSEQTLDNGRGYLYRSTEPGIAFAGNTNVTEASYALSYACDLDNMKGFNLIGNPFTHNIYKGATTAAISNTDDNEDVILAEDAYYFNTAEGTWSLLKDGNAIAPTQAILVQATTAATLSIVNSTAGASGGKYANDNIWFTVKNSEYNDDACVRFKEGRGLNKVEHRNDQAPMLYIMHNGENFASVDMPDNTRAINLGFEAKTMGQYTLSLKAEGQYSYIHLYDKLTGEDIDMLVEDSYSFIGTPSDRKDRFVLNLNYNAAGIDIESDIFAYQSGSEIIVSGEGELQIFDVMGRLVMNQRINGVETVIGLNNGVYIFKLEGKTQKIVVR